MSPLLDVDLNGTGAIGGAHTYGSRIWYNRGFLPIWNDVQFVGDGVVTGATSVHRRAVAVGGHP